ncbi:MAG: ApaG protein [Candidatus Latescibacterota bacterium]|jgi:ApaG protein
MVQQITKGIKVTVATDYEGTFQNGHKLLYAFSYTVTIENQGGQKVQLQHRHWDIHDALNELELVDGPGVVGETPVLEPNQSHSYTSGCYLISPFGSMSGYYLMQNLESGQVFKVGIPSFRLNASFAIN